MSDPAAGTFEFPGGHLEGSETPRQAAVREWQEETGLRFPDGEFTGTWTSPDGIYQGFVYTVASEADLNIFDRDWTSNPDDPDADAIEAIAWWDPAQLPGNPAVRPELRNSLGRVLKALAPCPCCSGTGEHSNGCECLYCDSSGTAIGGAGPIPCEGALDGATDVSVTTEGTYEATCPCGTPAVYDPIDGWQHADGSIGHEDGESVSDKMGRLVKANAKAGDGRPKGRAPEGDWPGWEHDERIARHWAPLIAAALAGALTTAQAQHIARDYPGSGLADGGQDRRAHVDAVAAWLAAQGIDPSGPVAAQLTGLYTDGYLIGAASAHAVVDGTRVELGDWTPGDTSNAHTRINEIGQAAGLAILIETVEEAARTITDGRLKGLARALIDRTAAGDSAEDIAAALNEGLADLDSATADAVTEITRASSLGALDAYQQRNVAMGYWATEGDRKVCATCAANGAASPVRMGGRYPSGDAYPPAHYRCRCAVLPA